MKNGGKGKQRERSLVLTNTVGDKRERERVNMLEMLNQFATDSRPMYI